MKELMRGIFRVANDVLEQFCLKKILNIPSIMEPVEPGLQVVAMSVADQFNTLVPRSCVWSQ